MTARLKAWARGIGLAADEGFREPFRLLARWFVCRWRGHRERRLRSNEASALIVGGQLQPEHRKQFRICTRCGAKRLARERKKVPKA